MQPERWQQIDDLWEQALERDPGQWSVFLDQASEGDGAADENPCRYGLVPVASSYPWCSAGWFERTATPVFSQRSAG